MTIVETMDAVPASDEIRELDTLEMDLVGGGAGGPSPSGEERGGGMSISGG